MRVVTVLTATLVAGAVLYFVVSAGQIAPVIVAPKKSPESERLGQSVTELNSWFRQRWSDEGVEAAAPADDLTVFRRLSLSLYGTVPSLEEIRSFQSDRAPYRLERWTDRMLQDQRFADYFAERLARSLVGTEGGAFVVYRRDRMTGWLSQQIKNDIPWNEITTELVAGEGLWTDRPESNFITAAQIPDEGLDENKLAGRTVRAFLGQRMDCAQCHDHPFDPRWKQSDFEGIAAFYGQARVTIGGVTDKVMEDKKSVEYRVVDPGQEETDGRLVEPKVPYAPEWLPTSGSRRLQLAAWIVHPENRRYERAIANRIWGLMFGKPLHEPVDDLDHPSDDETDALDILGRTFRENEGRLSVLIRVIAASEVFRLGSETQVETDEAFNDQQNAWAVFPLVRLRPEQLIGSLSQVGSVRAIDQNSHLITRFQRFTSENDFLKEYGDLGDDELLQQVGTIPQALLRMNGKFTRDAGDTNPLASATQLINYSADDQTLIQNVYLTCVARTPSGEEMNYFQRKLEEDGADRKTVVSDMYWSLINSHEFSWNH